MWNVPKKDWEKNSPHHPFLALLDHLAQEHDWWSPSLAWLESFSESWVPLPSPLQGLWPPATDWSDQSSSSSQCLQCRPWQCWLRRTPSMRGTQRQCILTWTHLLPARKDIKYKNPPSHPNVLIMGMIWLEILIDGREVVRYNQS